MRVGPTCHLYKKLISAASIKNRVRVEYKEVVSDSGEEHELNLEDERMEDGNFCKMPRRYLDEYRTCGIN